MGAKSRNKGKRGELEAAAELNRLFDAGARRGRQYHGRDEAPDVVSSLEGIHIEVKRVEKFSLYPSLQQCTNDAGGSIPLVLHRANNKPWVAVVRLEDLPALCRRLLDQTPDSGHNNPEKGFGDDEGNSG